MKGKIYKLALLFEEMSHELKEIAEMTVEQTTTMEGVTVTKDVTVEQSIVAKEVDVTIEDIRAVLAEKSQDGLTSKVKELLTSFGANKLSAVKVEDYPRLFMEAKKLK